MVGWLELLWWYQGAISKARAGQKKVQQRRLPPGFKGIRLHIIHAVGLAKILDAIDASQAIHEPAG